jgi:hypothetical protein
MDFEVVPAAGEIARDDDMKPPAGKRRFCADARKVRIADEVLEAANDKWRVLSGCCRHSHGQANADDIYWLPDDWRNTAIILRRLTWVKVGDLLPVRPLLM